MAEGLPVAVITGALGSGKTTLLRKLLAHPGMGETAVLVNELGEVGIDHHLLRQVDERTVLLASGCLCCTMRGDLADELRELLSRRDRGDVPPFERVVVETTGLAEPAPILHTLLAEPVVKHHFVLETVVATVDAQHGLARPEAVRQAAAADTLVVTKADAAGPDEVVALERELGRLNPLAQILEVSFGDVDPARLFAGASRGRSRDPTSLRLLRSEGSGENENHSHQDVEAFALAVDGELDWAAFGVWLTMLLQSRGADVLRVKGLLNVGAAGPVLLNGVQHVVHPPEHLDSWPDGDRRSRLVFIARGIGRAEVEASLTAFQRAARS
ncbi:MAG TPA: GTP-binding protein [Gaiellaceae bacterium]|nr:GTP-binding protein [Gaiellaceae bacterium]